MLYDNGKTSFVLLSGVGEDMNKYLHKPCVKTCHAQNCDLSVFSYLICHNMQFVGKHLCNTNNTNHT